MLIDVVFCSIQIPFSYIDNMFGNYIDLLKLVLLFIIFIIAFLILFLSLGFEFEIYFKKSFVK